MTSPHRYPSAPLPPAPTRGRIWSVLSAILLIIGPMLAPLSIVTAHAKNLITHTDTFVDTFAPLTEDPVIQGVVTTAVVDALADAFESSNLTEQLLADLDLSHASRRALSLFERRALDRALETISTLVEEVVSSDRFAAVWAHTLRTTHTQLIATLQNDPTATLTVDTAGSIELQLGPIIAEVKQRLVDRDHNFAQSIPDIQLGIPLTKRESLGSLHTNYALVTSLGTWLPWTAATFLAAGIALSRNRRNATIVAAFCLALTTAILGALILIGRHTIPDSLAQDKLPTPAIAAAYDAAVQSLGHVTLAIGILGLLVGIIVSLIRPTKKRPANN